MLIIKIIVDLACGALGAIGGWKWHNARRFIMPTLLAIAFSFVSHTWWLGLTALPVIGTLCLGYFGQKWLGRGLWLGLQGLVLGVGAVVSSHLLWWVYLPYVLLGFGLGALLFNFEQIIGDIIFYCWLGSIVFFLR